MDWKEGWLHLRFKKKSQEGEEEKIFTGASLLLVEWERRPRNS